ncbi:MAG: hypothetical protein IJ733_05280 [Lachnospiraceae bacterium]|nr:hypothetical protein [Lachnospiraceae bacterium]
MSDSIQALIDEEREEQDKETKAAAIKNVMDAFGVTIEKAMASLKIPQAQRSVYAGMIKK